MDALPDGGILLLGLHVTLQKGFLRGLLGHQTAQFYREFVKNWVPLFTLYFLPSSFVVIKSEFEIKQLDLSEQATGPQRATIVHSPWA